VTDGRTDGQTDRNLITIPRLYYMQRGKKTAKYRNTHFVYEKRQKVAKWA